MIQIFTCPSNVSLKGLKLINNKWRLILIVGLQFTGVCHECTFSYLFCRIQAGTGVAHMMSILLVHFT